jgi:DNA-binding PadR family transcriptional regulator
MDFKECPCSGKSLIRLVRPAILGVLAQGPLHGYLIIQKLERLTFFKNQSPDPTGIYRALKSMEEEGLLISKWDRDPSGPARRLFTLTEDGRDCLGRWFQTLGEYRKDIDNMIVFLTKTQRKGRR